MNFLRKLKNWNYRRHLKFVLSKIVDYKNIEGWLSDNEAYGLYTIAKQVTKNGIIVEIGSWKGKSTYCLARGLRKGKIFAIDPFNAEGEPGSKEIYEQTKGEKPLIEQFRDTMKKYHVLEKIFTLEGYSDQFVDKFKKIDFLFIDGDHSIKSCEYDYKTYSPFVTVGGYIAFHDYDPERLDLGPTWVINKYIKDSNFRFYSQFDSLWVAQKIS